MILNRATIVLWFPRDQRQQKYSSVCQKNNYCFCSLWLGKLLFGNFIVYIKHDLFLELYCILKLRIILGTVKSLNFFFIYWFHISIQLGNHNFQQMYSKIKHWWTEHILVHLWPHFNSASVQLHMKNCTGLFGWPASAFQTWRQIYYAFLCTKWFYIQLLYF